MAVADIHPGIPELEAFTLGSGHFNGRGMEVPE